MKVIGDIFKPSIRLDKEEIATALRMYLSKRQGGISINKDTLRFVNEDGEVVGGISVEVDTIAVC